MAIHECNILMQDYASSHRSKLVSDFLKKKNIKTMDWPCNSPDLNPIENLWAILKNKVADKHPLSAKDLEMTIKRIWRQTITDEYSKHLVYRILVVCKLLSRAKVDIPNIRFLHENWLMADTIKSIRLLFDIQCCFQCKAILLRYFE